MEKESPKEKEIAKDDQIGLSSASSSPVAVDLKQPEKKPTRQWAAWTRQEEENFFNALRQVGKNFEKITSRVQSKNKDQVRHYYYRLVRRMKKLLGPGFGLDAKNSKDTIAAMLRWWSLLEKYSCAASKLHLKPRRFKTFIEALAHQLLKDRNKTRRKQSNHEEAYSFTPPSSSSIITKGPGSDIDPVKFLFLDSQKNHKLAYPKKSYPRGNASVDINCSKGGLSIVKSMKHNRRTGLVASAAYKRWERAAVAGVSLVADAAEQLERTTNDMVCSSNQAAISNQPLKDRVQEDNAGSTANPVPCSPGGTRSHLGQSFVQAFTKLKLQLFPVDEFTRTELEKDHHNPYLELTLSGKKRMSSILEHLNCKWGKSSIALGELALLPYDVQVESLINCQKWTVRDRTACAADVYQIVGRPEVFRLRYGWLSNSVPGLRNFQFTEDVVGKITPAEQAKSNNVPENLSPIVDNGIPSSNAEIVTDGQAKSTNVKDILSPIVGVVPSSNAKIVTDGQAKFTNVQDILSPIVGVVPSSNATADVAVISMKPNFTYQETLQPTTTSCLPKAEETKSEKKQGHNEDNALNNLSTFSAREWADSLTNISVGDLLSEASRAADYSNDHKPCIVSCPPVKNSTLSCDSFDAAVAAHLFSYKNQQSTPNRVSQASLWDAEETCDEFSFKKISLKMSSKNQEDLNGSCKVPDKPCNQTNYSDTVGFSGLLKDTDQTEPGDICERGMMVDSDCTEAVSYETFDIRNAFALADIYWPDSLGAFDLGIPSFPRYSSQDLTFGDSLSQNDLLNRLINNSADAFQNLSFAGSEKRAQSTRDGEEAMSHSSKVKSEGS